jgi:hypothetical protein
LIPLTEFQLKRFSVRWRFLVQPIIFVGCYGLWVFALRLLSLTLIAYFTISPNSRFQDISDAFSSNEVSLMGLSALLFIVLLVRLNPLTSTVPKEIVSRERIEKDFLPGFIQGAAIAGGLILLFVLSGVYRYLGYFIQLGEAPLELANVLLRMATLVALAYCEEYIFRERFTRPLKDHLSSFTCANLGAIFYIGIKVLQFDLGWMHLLTLYLIALTLFYRDLESGSFSKGAGLWAGILVVFHPVSSLPIFGNHFSGILLVKYPASSIFSSEGWQSFVEWIRFLTGGAGGPISSFTFQFILLLDISRSILRKRVTS